MRRYRCFGNERAYADYMDKQDSPPSEIKAYYVENGVKIVYSDSAMKNSASMNIA